MLQDTLGSKMKTNGVGEPVQAGTSTHLGYSRFTTSPSVPAWLVGTAAPTARSVFASERLNMV